MRPKQAIVILIIIAVVLGGIGYVAIKASDLKLPSHGDFRRMHSGGNE